MNTAKDDMLPEYDFSNGVRGKYARRYKNSNAIVIDQDLIDKFPNSEKVNKALREYIKIKTR